MCRSTEQGGRRCPGCSSQTGRVAHNDRRRHNRAVRRAVAAWATEQGEPVEVMAMLAAAAPSVAKTWARDHGAPPDVVAHPLHSPARADGRPEPDPAGQWWFTPDLVERMSAAIAGQANDPQGQDLLAADLTAVPFHSTGVNQITKVELSTGGAAFHKPFTNGELNFGDVGNSPRLRHGPDPDLYDQALHEVAAYRFSQALGEPWAGLVPTCVLRAYGGELGSLSRAAPGRPAWSTGEVDEPYLMTGAFFDALVGERDRHAENMLTHESRLSLIDHGFAFAPETRNPNSRLLEWRHDHDRAALTPVELAAVDRVLASNDTLGIAALVGGSAAGALRGRALQMRSTQQLPMPARFI